MFLDPSNTFSPSFSKSLMLRTCLLLAQTLAASPPDPLRRELCLLPYLVSSQMAIVVSECAFHLSSRLSSLSPDVSTALFPTWHTGPLPRVARNPQPTRSLVDVTRKTSRPCLSAEGLPMSCVSELARTGPALSLWQRRRKRLQDGVRDMRGTTTLLRRWPHAGMISWRCGTIRSSEGCWWRGKFASISSLACKYTLPDTNFFFSNYRSASSTTPTVSPRWTTTRPRRIFSAHA
jgi:hypothetical protein